MLHLNYSGCCVLFISKQLCTKQSDRENSFCYHECMKVSALLELDQESVENEVSKNNKFNVSTTNVFIVF